MEEALRSGSSRALLWTSLALLAASCHRSGSDLTVAPPSTAPATSSDQHAAFVDRDQDGTVSRGDELWLAFDQALALGADLEGALQLPVDGDASGESPRLGLFSEANVVRLQLGDPSRLRARGVHGGDLDAGGPSGLRVSPNMPVGALVSASTGLEVQRAGLAVDIVPEFERGPSSVPFELPVAADMDCDGRMDLVVSGQDQGGSVAVLLQGASGSLFSAASLSFDGVLALDLADINQDGRPDLAFVLDDGTVRVYTNEGSQAGEVNLIPAANLSFTSLGNPQDLTWADLNRDGDPDLLVGTTAALLQSFGGPDATFGQPFGLGGPQDSFGALATGDFDRSGTADVFAAGQGTDYVFLMAPNGLIQQTIQRSSADRTLDSQVLDVDRDGRLDLALATEGQVLLWRQQGLQGFVPSLLDSLPLSQGARQLRAGDLDKDGAMDLVLLSPDWLEVRGGDGLGSFTRSPRRRALQGARGLALADLDSDGDLDALSGGDSTTLWLGSAAAGFGPAPLTAVPNPNPQEDQFPGVGTTFAVHHADWDLDGDLDVLTGGPGAVRVWRNDGDDSFSLAQRLDIGSDRAHKLFVGDFDQDGTPDLVAACVGSASRIWIGQPDGTFYTPAINLAPGANATALAAGDLDGDGDLDLFLGTVRTLSDRVLLNGGRALPLSQGDNTGSGGGWNGFDDELPFVNTFQTNDASLADLDCDGDLDLVLAQGLPDQNTVWRNTLDEGNLALVPVTGLGFPSQQTHSVRVADFNRDGFLDLFFGSRPGANLRLGNGTLQPGTFQVETLIANGAILFAESGDLDDDGWLDVLVASEASAGIQVHLGGPEGLSPVPTQVLPSQSPRFLSLGDRDGDGDLDLVGGEAALGQPNLLFRAQ